MLLRGSKRGHCKAGALQRRFAGRRGWRSLLAPSLSISRPPSLDAVAAALGKDVLFVRVKAATFALQSVINYHSQLRHGAAAGGAAPAGDGGGAGGAEGAGGQEPRSPDGSKMAVVKVEEEQQQEGHHHGEEEDEEEDEVGGICGGGGGVGVGLWARLCR